MAEAVLAAAEQAASACVPVKRKKAAAEVVTGDLHCLVQDPIQDYLYIHIYTQDFLCDTDTAAHLLAWTA